VASVAVSRFKQRAVIVFLVHEKESVLNIHKRLCAVYGSCAVDRSTVGRWDKRVKASGSADRPATANTPYIDVPSFDCVLSISAQGSSFVKLFESSYIWAVDKTLSINEE
jgi:hypothetical protein